MRIKRSGTRESLLLDCFDDQETDLLELLYVCLEERRARLFVDQAARESLEIESVTRRGRQVEGVVQGGRFGRSAQIRDVTTGLMVFDQGRDHAGLAPFYFLLELPTGRDMGFLILQQTGNDSPYTSLAKILQARLRMERPEHRLQFSRFTPESAIRQASNDSNQYNEIRFIRHTAPADRARAVEITGTDQEEGRIELVLKYKGPLARLQLYLRERALQQRGREPYLELEDAEFRYDTVKVRVRVNGKERTMDLGNPTQLRAAYDITDDVTVSQETGHPEFVSISTIARALMDDLRSDLAIRAQTHVAG